MLMHWPSRAAPLDMIRQAPDENPNESAFTPLGIEAVEQFYCSMQVVDQE
jgi:hypothetical protein